MTRTIAPHDAAPELLDLISRLMPILLAGDEPIAAVIREQYAQATITEIDLTGLGFFAKFVVPASAPRAKKSFGGGDVRIDIAELPSGAGCVLFVRGGVLQMLEVYANAEDWPDRFVVTGFGYVLPWAEALRGEKR